MTTTFDALLSATGLPEAIREYRFAPPRRWRFDYAWPAQRSPWRLREGYGLVDATSGVRALSATAKSTAKPPCWAGEYWRYPGPDQGRASVALVERAHPAVPLIPR